MEPDTITEFDASSAAKTSRHRRRKGKVWWALWEKVSFGKDNKPLKHLSKDNEHDYEQLSQMNDEYISSNETRMAMEPVKPESERLFIQPTPKSSTPEIDDSKSSSSPRPLLHRREGQGWPLWERAADGKENKSLNHLSKDDEDEDEQLSHQDDKYISFNETRMAMKPDTTEIKPESERLFIQPTENPSTAGFDDSSSIKTVIHRGEGEEWPLRKNWGRIPHGAENKPLQYLSKDGEHADDQLSHMDDEYSSSNETNMAMESDTTEFKPESGRLLKTALEFPYKEEGDKDGQFSMDDESIESLLDELLLSDDENSTQDGWLGNADQKADLVLVLRWARAYRVSIEVAGRMLNRAPEIVSRALRVHANPKVEEALLRRSKPVIKTWWKLGPI